jgi:DNA-binding NtrC family response regulator
MEDLLGFEGMIGQSAAMQALFDRIRRVAPYDVPVLILGETGTGKELVAAALHRLSRRRGARFEAVNCGALTRERLRSELYGHERGAFTGVVDRRTGLLREAAGGTVVLDEVGELTADAQAQVAQVIRDAVTRPASVGVRVVGTTQRNLAAAVRAGRFRPDLYYALRRAVLVVPPLRARLDDLPLLVEHVRRTVNARHGTAIDGVTAGALERLAAHAWPGNVRELAAVLEEAMLLQGDGWIDGGGLALDPPPRAVRILTAPGSEDRGRRASTHQVIALELAARSDGVSTSQFARAAARSLAQARRDLGALVRHGRLRRVGRGRLAHYVLA